MFNFSKEYKEHIVTLFVFSIAMWLVVIVLTIKPPESFVYCVDATNQPNCVVGAYCMYAKDVLNKQLLIGTLTNSYPILGTTEVGMSAVDKIWNDLFPTNNLVCVYNSENDDTFTNGIVLKKPYIWVGRWDDNTNTTEYHACIVKLYEDSVVFKHFVYNPKTHTNYTVRTNYNFFFERTSRIYTSK